MNNKLKLAVAAFALAMFGCSTVDVEQAQKGQRFDRTGFFAFYSNQTGFNGPIVGPGTYYTGMYGDIRAVDCSQTTVKTNLNVLTKDGVNFTLDVYVRMSANCGSDDAIKLLLGSVVPDAGGTISVTKLYETYVLPALSKAVRMAVSPYVANDINQSRTEIFSKIGEDFDLAIKSQTPQLINIYELNLNNLDFPDKLEQANVDRAQQAILKDKAIAEMDRVKAETETAKARLELEQSKAANEAARIVTVGLALRQYPEYLQFQLQQQMPDIYRDAGAHGNMVITAPSPNVFISPKPTVQ